MAVDCSGRHQDVHHHKDTWLSGSGGFDLTTIRAGG
jgi:hypothetical protein